MMGLGSHKTVRAEMDLTANKSQNDCEMSKVKNKDRCMEQINGFLTMRCTAKTAFPSEDKMVIRPMV
jgi:hypothetical protein